MQSESRTSSRTDSNATWLTLAGYVLGSVAVIWRLALIWKFLPQPVETENMRAGFALATTGILADPFLLPTGPTAHVAPMYPALIAACVLITGDPHLGFDVARSVVVLCFGGFVATLPLATLHLGLGRASGLVAALMFVPAGIPVFAWIEASGQHEAVLTAVWLFALVVVTARALRAESATTLSSVGLGLAWGIGAHTSPLLVLALAGLLSATVIAGNHTARANVRHRVVPLVAALAIALTPWTIRNASVLNRVTLIRDNFGLELAVSNADDASPDMRSNMLRGGTMSRHPFLDSTEARRMAALGESTYYSAQGKVAVDWIRTHPAAFARLSAERMRLYFFPRLGMQHHRLFYLFIMTMGLLGLVRLFRRDRLTAVVLLGALLGFSGPYFLVQAHARYAYPILWIPAVLSAWGTLDLLAAFRCGKSVRLDTTRDLAQ